MLLIIRQSVDVVATGAVTCARQIFRRFDADFYHDFKSSTASGIASQHVLFFLKSCHY